VSRAPPPGTFAGVLGTRGEAAVGEAPGPVGGAARRWFNVVVVAVAVVVVGWLAVSARADIADAARLLDHVRWRWVGIAVACGVLTLSLFACVRVVLVGAIGIRLGVMSAISLTYASGAIAASVPAGGALATAYVFRQYRAAGASAGDATWAVLVNGVVTPAVLAVLGLAGVALAAPSGWTSVLIPVVVALAWVAVAWWILRDPSVLRRPLAAVLRFAQRVRRRSTDGVESTVSELTAQLAAVHPGLRRSAAACAVQLASWLADVGCLAASIVAVGGDVPWRPLLAVYAAAELAGRIPLLPGGLGQVETGLVVGLTAAGMPAPTALAATLLYRIASQWLVVPIGWAAWVFRKGQKLR
jgi:putative heme transporter